MAASPLAASAVALVVALTPQGARTGTAFAVSSDSNTTRLLTAYHVIDGASKIVLFSPFGEQHTATVIARDRVRDAALLSIDEGDAPTLSLEIPPQDVPGGNVSIIGYPGQRPVGVMNDDIDLRGSTLPTTSTGTLRGMFQTGESIVFEANVAHGDSGAPVIDASTGKVIGMTT